VSFLFFFFFEFQKEKKRKRSIKDLFFPLPHLLLKQKKIIFFSFFLNFFKEKKDS